jgi:hypothetical protein
MMRLRRLRWTKWAVLPAILLPLGVVYASVISPSLVTFLGGNPASTIYVPPGSVILLVINKTTGVATITASLTRSNGDAHAITGSIPAGAFFPVSIPCPVSTVQVASVAVDGTAIANYKAESFVDGINLSCGAVVSYKIVPDGSDPAAPVDDDTQPDVIVEDYFYNTIPIQITTGATGTDTTSTTGATN